MLLVPLNGTVMEITHNPNCNCVLCIRPGLANFSIKNQTVSILGFVGLCSVIAIPRFSVLTTQRFCCSTNTAPGSTEMNVAHSSETLFMNAAFCVYIFFML